MMLIGLTGSLGSGKSTVGRMFGMRGAAVIDADGLTRGLQAPGGLLLQKIVQAFGADVLMADGTLNRSALAAIVFSDPAALRRLNRLVHPAVRRQEAALVALMRQHPVVALEIPLLFENRLHRLLDWVVVVSADEAVRLRRLGDQRGLDEAEARRRMKAQWPDALKSRLAHFTIENSGNLAVTEKQVARLWVRLLGMNRNQCKTGGRFINPFIPFRRGEHA